MKEVSKIKKSLLDLAKGDLRTSEILIKNKNDEVIVNISAYHVQQAIEKTIKFMLLMEGIRPPKTHDIDELINLLPESSKIKVPLMIEAHKYMINDWATKTRYSQNYKSSIDIINIIIEELKEFISKVSDEYIKYE